MSFCGAIEMAGVVRILINTDAPASINPYGANNLLTHIRSISGHSSIRQSTRPRLTVPFPHLKYNLTIFEYIHSRSSKTASPNSQ